MEITPNKAQFDLKSKYSQSVNLNLPLNDYPRPQMARDLWINLNGYYDYAVYKKGEDVPVQYQGKIVVPFCIESSISQVKKSLLPDEILRYHRTFEMSEVGTNQSVILNFEAVDYMCEVFVNNQFVGKNRGGYLPFSFDISKFIQSGTNELIVSVEDPTDTFYQERGKQVLNPKGIWYTATSGIWQTVWIEIVPTLHFESVKIIPDVDNSKIRIHPTCRTENAFDVKVTIFDKSKKVLTTMIPINKFTEITITNPKLWSPESPNIYDVTMEIIENDVVIDKIKTYFGLRKIHIAKDNQDIPRIFLNNKQYFQSGVLDQGYFPESLLTPPTDQAMIDDIETMKSLGFNMLRKHIKIEPRRWYSHCDRIGMLVWQDMPSGGQGYIGDLLAVGLPNIGIHVRDKHYKRFHRQDFIGRQAFETDLKGMINHLFNHPSICTWVPFNEGWGQFDALRIGQEVKKYDPSRLVDHASGWHDQKGPDFVSIHKYIFEIKMPKKDRNRPFVLSEFGGYSQILSNHVWDEKNSFGYKMFDTKTALSDAYEQLFHEQVLPLVSKGLCACIYTQLSDVELEVNGLLTYDREIIKLEKFMVIALNNQLINPKE